MSKFLNNRFALFAFLSLAMSSQPGHADTPLPLPEGRVVLEVSGAIDNTNRDDKAAFDLAQLKSLPSATITTSTPWTDGVVTFIGVPVDRLLQVVGAHGDGLSVTALNDYTATMSATQLIEAGAILAYEMDGKQLSIRDKGPLWVIFPFDDNEAYQTDAYWANAVWQVKSMTVKQ